jgi:hypothetical protein
VAGGVASCHGDGSRRDVGGDDARARKFLREHDREHTAAGADVDEQRLGRRIDDVAHLQGRFDDQLGLGTRDEHVGRHLEVDPPELAGADDVGNRLAPKPARDEMFVVEQERARRGFVASRQKTSLIPAEHLTSQELGVERGKVGADAGLNQAAAGALNEIVNRHERSPACLTK